MAQVIGEFFHNQSEFNGEWRILDFLVLPAEIDKKYCSGEFFFAGARWELHLYPQFESQYWPRGYIGLYLHRKDYVSPLVVTISLGIRMADGNKEIKIDIRRVTFDHNKRSIGSAFCARQYLLERREILVPLEALTITCNIKVDQLHSVDIRPLISRETQTEGSDIGIDRSFLSRETQTEDSEIEIGKEKDNEHTECSSLEAKGITLLQKHMKELLAMEKDADVRICVSNKEFQAHRNILKARSPVFDKMLTYDTLENNSGTINIEDCDPDAFEEFLLYIYTGKTESLTTSKALNLYHIADKYDFNELMEQCVSFLKTSLSKSSVSDVILFASKREQGELLQEATNFFVENIDEILITVEWQNFLSTHPIEANELFIKSRKI